MTNWLMSLIITRSMECSGRRRVEKGMRHTLPFCQRSVSAFQQEAGLLSYKKVSHWDCTTQRGLRARGGGRDRQLLGLQEV